MVNRRGMDKGRGKGYRNIIGKDSRVHSLSAKGIKQPQNPKFMKKQHQYSDDLERIDDFSYGYKGHTINIHFDETPWNPRDEMDNLGTMATFHNKYDLPNESDFTADDFSGWEEMGNYLYEKKNAEIVLPIYMYDHSGVSIKVGSFAGLLPQGHAEFDSGKIGYIYLTKDDIRKEYGKVTEETKKKAEQVLRGEVETYNQYAQGDVYGYTIYNDETGEEVDSLWGIYGSDEAINMAKEAIDAEVKRPKYEYEQKVEIQEVQNIPEPFNVFEG